MSNTGCLCVQFPSEYEKKRQRVIFLISLIREYEQQIQQWDLAFIFSRWPQARHEHPMVLRDRRAPSLSAPSLAGNVSLPLSVMSRQSRGACRGHDSRIWGTTVCFCHGLNNVLWQSWCPGIRWVAENRRRLDQTSREKPPHLLLGNLKHYKSLIFIFVIS